MTADGKKGEAMIHIPNLFLLLLPSLPYPNPFPSTRHGDFLHFRACFHLIFEEKIHNLLTESSAQMHVTLSRVIGK